MRVEERLLKYVSYWTTSDEECRQIPSSERQFELGKVLEQELRDLGLEKVTLTDHCYVYGLLPATKGYADKPAVGFISHMDTAPDFSGKDVKPQIIPDYDGNDVLLKGSGAYLKVSDFPTLKTLKGRTLITTDGTTLLGADDKAGIAEIMDMLEYFARNNDEHGDILVCFTPDEEIGLGVKNLNTNYFNPDFAYTVDGIDLGEFSYENFNAGSAQVKIKGVPAHLGYAKGTFINALRVAIEFDSMVPKEYPENTEGKEGYFVLHNLNGDICEVTMQYNIRDFEKDNLIKRKEILSKIAKILNRKYGNIIEIGFKDSYCNMYDTIKNEELLISGTLKSISSLGIEPKVVPIRGGTDGAEITALGIPCPNLGAGGHNFHTIYEYVCLEDMISTSEILKSIVKTFSNETTRKRKP
mgnify:CR=1 FL=1